MQEKKDPQPKSASSLGKVGQISQWLTVCFSSQCLCVFVYLCAAVCVCIFPSLVSCCFRASKWISALRIACRQSSSLDVHISMYSVSVWLCICVGCDSPWSICFEVNLCVLRGHAHFQIFFICIHVHANDTVYCKVWRPCRAPNGMDIQCVRISFYLGCQCWSLWYF